MILPSKHPFRFLLVSLAFLLLLSTGTQAQFNRGTQMTFGKSRVQYDDFLWTYYRFKNFDTYFYLGGQEMATYIGRTADTDIEELEKLFDYRINGRFEFIVYNRLSDFKQSNIGLTDDESTYNTGGLTKIVGNKILLYFDGDYRHLHAQVRAGVAQVMINQLMYGGGIKDRLQSAVLLNLPEWYIDGLISYVANGWDAEYDNRMRDGITSGRYSHFNRMAATETVFAGHSVWNYIVETYGATSISNLLYMTRINRNAESGFLYVLGINTKELTQNWLSYYQRQYVDDDKDRVQPTGKPVVTIRKPARMVNQVKVSPDGSKIAYVTNDLGKYRVWVYDSRTNKRKRIAKGGFKSQQQTVDLTYPVLAWHPGGRTVTAILERKGKLWMYYLNPEKRRKKEVNKFFYFDKVLSVAYNAAGSEMILSAVQKGQSDLYTFNPRTKTYQQLTHDHWDDQAARFALDDKYIVFSSDRPEDSIKTTSFKRAEFPRSISNNDIFLYDYTNRSEQLIRLTNTPGVNEYQPSMFDATHFTYLSDENGITNRMISTLDSTIAYVDTAIHYRYIVKALPATNYSRNIIEQDINNASTRLAEINRLNNRYQIYLHPTATRDSVPAKLRKTALRLRLDKTLSLAPKPVISQTPTIKLPEEVKVFIEKPAKETPPPSDTTKVDIYNYTFQSEFGSKKKKHQGATINQPDSTTSKSDSATTKPILVNVPDSTSSSIEFSPVVLEKKPVDSLYMMPKQRNYDIAFSADYLLTQLDNGMLNDAYQTYTGGAVYFDPGLNALIRFGLHDLFDDYKITGGVRLAGDLNSNEYLLTYQNLKHRLDREFIFFRQAR